MGNELNGTKLDLILAAGEIFARDGLLGASIRTIAKKAGANIAAINYHFGSKENLYKEVLRFIHKNLEEERTRVLEGYEKKVLTRKGFTELLRKIIKSRFNIMFSEKYPRWYHKLLMRGLFDAYPAFLDLTKELFEPDFYVIQNLALLANPEMTEQDAELWVFSLYGRVVIYSFAQGPILKFMGKEKYPEEYIEAAARYIAGSAVNEIFMSRSEPGKE